ncbi:transcriptional regulator IlvY [Lonsdalea britannica]|uniref:HTH-type transcriptional activator IlvY n=1 Tax=Lonsdalea britannica TaxID=1082704 RepID=A0AAD0SE51_9GAMM|nr:HTH-type transcriptional activator IlvY [Lonsdalea britannica]AXW86267.1 HTH-type transcriptional activator IlvY [Lonsdalea britannica]OSM94360.1 transcriptional regulator IlvY [Lonsdalea britannica]OSN05994.1 transcriptional regulator IlvY [Lonsdalea britannica]
MDLRDLKLFLHLVESHHFGHTAKAMHISPSTLSRQIQRMEEDIGQALFLRDNRTVRLTDAGEHLKIFAQQTLLQYQQMQLAMSQHGQSLSGELRVFCSVTGAYSHLPTILDRFRARHPLVEIKLTTGDAADAVDKVRSNVADLSIAGHPELLPPSMVFIPIGNIRIALVIPTMPCPVQVQMQDPHVDWSQVPFILPQYGPVRKLTERWFRHQKIASPLIYATVSGHEAMVSMVAVGCGVALVPDVVLENSPEPVRNRVFVLQEQILEPIPLGICMQKKRLSEPLIAAFWETLQETQ